MFGKKEPKKDSDKELSVEELKKQKAEIEEKILRQRSDDIDNKEHKVESESWVAKMMPSTYEPAIMNIKTGEVLTMVEAIAKILEQQEEIKAILG